MTNSTGTAHLPNLKTSGASAWLNPLADLLAGLALVGGLSLSGVGLSGSEPAVQEMAVVTGVVALGLWLYHATWTARRPLKRLPTGLPRVAHRTLVRAALATVIIHTALVGAAVLDFAQDQRTSNLVGLLTVASATGALIRAARVQVAAARAAQHSPVGRLR